MPSVIDEIIDIYENRATKRYGLTAINQQQHALQAAALAEAKGEGAALIVAALLHDIGHMVHDLGENPAEDGVDDRHEALGAAWLERYFGADVTEPVRLHVPAKRYLCAVDRGYFSKLSQDSVISLGLQGGEMNPDEVREFEQNAYADAAVRLRRLDEAAKEAHAETPPVRHFVPYIEQVLAPRGKSRRGR